MKNLTEFLISFQGYLFIFIVFALVIVGACIIGIKSAKAKNKKQEAIAKEQAEEIVDAEE